MLRLWWLKTKQNHMKRVEHEPPYLTLHEWLDTVRWFGNRCAYCDQPPEDGKLLELEHLVPLTRGGFHRADNVVPACGPCNKSKGTMTHEEYFDKLDSQRESEKE